MSTLSVILPLYRNADTVEPLLERLRGTLAEPFEVIGVDDCGGDDSAARLAAAGARLGVPVRLVRHRRNWGQNVAVMSGLHVAHGPRFLIMDADLQDPPEAAARLVAALDRSRCDIVFGLREGEYAGRGRLRSSRLFKRLLLWLAGARLDPRIGLFVALSWRAGRRLVSMEVGSPYVVGMLATLELPTVTVRFERQIRPSGASSYTSWKRFRVGLIAFACVIECRLRRLFRWRRIIRPRT